MRIASISPVLHQTRVIWIEQFLKVSRVEIQSQFKKQNTQKGPNIEE